MLNQKRPALVFHQALFQSNLTPFDLGNDLLQLGKRLLKASRRDLILLAHRHA